MNEAPDWQEAPHARNLNELGSQVFLDHESRIVTFLCDGEISPTRAQAGAREARKLANELGFKLLFDLGSARMSLSLADAYFLPRDPKVERRASEQIAVILEGDTTADWGPFLELTSANAGLFLRTFPDRERALSALSGTDAAALEAAPTGNPLILVVDDDPDILALTVRVLENAGYRTLQASTGQEGLEVALREQPDLVLMDVVLPDMDGREACRILKTDPSAGDCIVALTSGLRTSLEDQEESLDAKPDAYLTRPINNESLLSSVRLLFQWQRAAGN